ncbi:hypothetical protein [Streptomyces aidingensis]|nr:hypothetical protein [Streptomyces aidingensis]
MSVIAVAGGRSTADDLLAAGAETVLPDLTDSERLVGPAHGNGN